MQLGANDVGHDRFGDLIHKSIGRAEPLRMCRSMHVRARIDPDVQDLGVQLGAALSRAASTQGGVSDANCEREHTHLYSVNLNLGQCAWFVQK